MEMGLAFIQVWYEDNIYAHISICELSKALYVTYTASGAIQVCCCLAR